MKAGHFLLWADLQPEDLAELDGASDETAAKSILANLLHLDGEPSRVAVLLELYHNALAFARKHTFSVEKTSTFFSIVKHNHEEMVSGFLPPQKSWEYFKVAPAPAPLPPLLASHLVSHLVHVGWNRVAVAAPTPCSPAAAALDWGVQSRGGAADHQQLRPALLL